MGRSTILSNMATAGSPSCVQRCLALNLVTFALLVHFVSGLSLSIRPHRAMGHSWSQSLDIPDIRFTDETYRKYVGKRDPQHPWHNGPDVLAKRGYHMMPVQAAVIDGHVNTSMGVMSLQADTPFVLQDFYQAYKLDTIWPYCGSIHKCLVYVQQDNPAAKAPMTITLPPGVAAIDLYIDAAIDCVKTLRAVVKCRALVEPGNIEVKFRFSSICASPFVGKYAGFFDESGDSISRLQLRCKSSAPTALGLVRIGNKRWQQQLVHAPEFEELDHEQLHLQQQ